MCFSAQASFTVAVGLFLLYSYTVRVAKNRADKLFATTQLFFALQQLCEGFVWITLNRNDTASLLHQISTYGFLFFAFGLWPFWIPFALYQKESTAHGKKLMKLFLALGTLLSCVLFGATLFYGATSSLYFRHILYEIPAPWLLSFIGFLLYVGTTLVPLFLSKIPGTYLLALTGSIGLAASLISYRFFFVSVWCFFAALSSAIITFLILHKADANRSK
jgi:hypothetical protein